MGISEQSYRIIIGVFVSSQIQKKMKKILPFGKKSMGKKVYIYMFCFLLVNTLWSEAVNLSIKDESSKSLSKPNLFPIFKNGDKTFCNFALNNSFVLVTDVNFYARYINGNRTNRGLKISHWNLGSAYLENKMHEIETVVADLRPHLFGVSESNYFKSQNKENVMLNDYDLITASTIDNPSLEVSEVVVYKHKSVIAKG